MLFTNVANPARTSRPPRLALRFAIYTGIALLVVGLAMLWVLDRDVETRAEQRAVAQSQHVAEATLRRHLEGSDFAGAVTPARRRALDSTFQDIVIGGFVRATLFNRSGQVTYSTAHSLIRTTRPPDELGTVLDGRPSRSEDFLGETKVLRTSVPVRLVPGGRPIGALSLEQDYGAIDVQIAEAFRNTAVILFVALLALWGSLIPILRRATRQLHERNRQLVAQASELAEQNERLRELDRLKDEFISLVSHELRTPLTSIRGYLELLLDGGAGELSHDQGRFLAVVDRNSRRLMHLVGDLLFLAQVEAGKLTLELGEVGLEDVVTESVEAAKPIADEKRIELRASIEPVPLMVGDRGRLAQVLDNLVSNALKFSTAGGSVDVRVWSKDSEAVVEVVDTGIGIGPEAQAHLFDRFYRSTAATERAIPGTGLGLTIVKAIVERHEGTIEVESEEDKGTTMRVRLPARAPHPVAEEAA